MIYCIVSITTIQQYIPKNHMNKLANLRMKKVPFSANQLICYCQFVNLILPPPRRPKQLRHFWCSDPFLMSFRDNPSSQWCNYNCTNLYQSDYLGNLLARRHLPLKICPVTTFGPPNLGTNFRSSDSTFWNGIFSSSAPEIWFRSSCVALKEFHKVSIRNWKTALSPSNSTNVIGLCTCSFTRGIPSVKLGEWSFP